MLEHFVRIFKPHENLQKHEDALEKEAEVRILLQKNHNSSRRVQPSIKGEKAKKQLSKKKVSWNYLLYSL